MSRSSLLFYGYLIGVAFAVLVAGLAINGNHNLAVQAKTTAIEARQAAVDATRALCAQKQGYRQTLQAGKDYLRKHPHGTRDFSRDVIVASILQSTRQLKAFHDVTCGS
jgi:hypothetical protein